MIKNHRNIKIKHYLRIQVPLPENKRFFYKNNEYFVTAY